MLVLFIYIAVLIWDDTRESEDNKYVHEVTFKQNVVAVRMRRDRLIVVLTNKIHVFSFPNKLRELVKFDIRHNPKGKLISLIF